ncbi:MAG: Gfo/Idh/MocA family oxidoreductase, partial [Planctomycetota bacterium]|nr:Gfo/Idh/MocA family oxidoreductase [Planctomycetota bacterium]
EIIAVQTVFSSDAQALPAWKRRRATGGGALLDLASHHFDLICWLVNSSPLSISCTLRSTYSEDDTAMVQLEFENGVVAQIMASLCAGDNDRLEIYGTAGRLVVDRYRSDRVEIHPMTLDRVRAQRFADAARAFASPSYWKAKLTKGGPEASFWRALGEFADSSLANRSPSPDLLDGLRSLALVEAAERASAERRRMPIEPLGCDV